MTEIKEFLMQLGFNPAIKGFACAAEAIHRIMQGYDSGLCNLYKEIAKKHNCEWRSVERAIRTEIKQAIKRNPHFRELLGLPEFWREAERISNGVVLYTAAECLKFKVASHD